jgi:hypothetical protein
LKQDWAADKLTTAFAELKISPQKRAEKLSLELGTICVAYTFF